MLQPDPFIYKVSKVKNTSPKGVIEFTLKQDEFVPDIDYVNLDTGEMIAGYYYSSLDPSEDDKVAETSSKGRSLEITSATYNIGIGMEKHIDIEMIDEDIMQAVNYDPAKLTWSFVIESTDDEIDGRNDIVEILSFNENRLIVRLENNEDLVHSALIVTCKYEELQDTRKFNIVY